MSLSQAPSLNNFRTPKNTADSQSSEGLDLLDENIEAMRQKEILALRESVENQQESLSFSLDGQPGAATNDGRIFFHVPSLTEFKPEMGITPAEAIDSIFLGDTEFKMAEEFDFSGLKSDSELHLKVRMLNGEELEYTLIFTPAPVIQLNFDQTRLDEDEKGPAIFRLSSGSEGDQTPLEHAGIEGRGESTAGLWKRSYAVSTRNRLDWNKNKKTKILDFKTSDDDYVLNASMGDLSLLNNKITNDLFREMSPPKYNSDADSAITEEYVEVIVNGEYRGVYLASRKLDRKVLGLKKARMGQIGGSRLYTEGRQKYPKVTEEAPEDKDSLVNLKSALRNYDGNFAGLRKIIDIDNAINWHALVLFSAGSDNIHHNYYLARNGDGPFFMAPWDSDLTYNPEDVKLDLDFSSPAKSNPIISNLMKIPEYRAHLKARWLELRSGPLETNSVIQRFQQEYDFLRKNGMYNRNAGPILTTFEVENERLREYNGGEAPDEPELTENNFLYSEEAFQQKINFVRERLDYLDKKMASL